MSCSILFVEIYKLRTYYRPTEPLGHLYYRRSYWLNYRVERQDVSESEVGPWIMVYLYGR